MPYENALLVAQSGPFSNLVGQYFSACPLFIVWLLGAAAAVATWQRHPQVSALVLTAMGIELLVALLNPVIGSALWSSTLREASGSELLRYLYGFIVTGLEAIAYLILIVAAFRWRGESEGKE